MSAKEYDASIVLQKGVSLLELGSCGSTFEINSAFQNCYEDVIEEHDNDRKSVDILGEPIRIPFDRLPDMSVVDMFGYVKKKILTEGGGASIDKSFTVNILLSGYFENAEEPFDAAHSHKPLVCDMNDNGLLPGLQTAVSSMLVGEISMFLLSYEVMYGILGNPPKIKPKANAVYYIQVIKGYITPKQGALNFSESNIFDRVCKEVKLLSTSGSQFYKSNNIRGAIQCFRKAIGMLHRCRLADDKEEGVQVNLLVKIYLNLAVCYNKSNQPLKACTACNEIHRLNNLWNNGKALFQNARALIMINQFSEAERKLKRAMVLCPDSEEMKQESQKLFEKQNTFSVNVEPIHRFVNNQEIVSDRFKAEVNRLIDDFQKDKDARKITLPQDLNEAEKEYVKELSKKRGILCTKKLLCENNRDVGNGPQ